MKILKMNLQKLLQPDLDQDGHGYVLKMELWIYVLQQIKTTLLMLDQCGGTPILALDVWEHAYYLNYQNETTRLY